MNLLRDELNALWKRAEEVLSATKIGVPVSVDVPPAGDEVGFRLWWRRHGAVWRICVCEEPEEWVPVSDTRHALKVRAAHHLVPLMRQLEMARDQAIADLRRAIGAMIEVLG
jgi:hypothetical protein